VRAPLIVEAPAAAHASQREDGYAGRAQRLHVAVNGSLRDLEPRGHLPSGLFALGLKQQERGEQAIGSHDCRWSLVFTPQFA
jgi:hypothetical protein